MVRHHFLRPELLTDLGAQFGSAESQFVVISFTFLRQGVVRVRCDAFGFDT